MRHLPACGLLYLLCSGLFIGAGCQSWGAEGGVVLIPAGSVWKYLDTGTNLGPTLWRALNYDDSAWGSGNAPLGYGESIVATTVSYGPDPDNKYVTTYFRQKFNVTDGSSVNRLFLRVLRDDGLIVYLNGAEIFRNNMPWSAGYKSFATTNVFGGAERTYYTADFEASLINGTNVLAVELHQAGADSPDLDFDLELSASNMVALTRGPYLQIGTPTSLIVRWRTDLAGSSRVLYGTNLAALNGAAGDAASTTEHVVQLSGLQPNTKYYYSIGTSFQTVAGGPEFYFITGPTNGKATRIWVTGDTRAGDMNQAAVRDAYYQHAGSRYTDLWLMLGDYSPAGADEEMSACLFDFYPEMLRQTVVWPCIGNHESRDIYLQNFTLPTQGEAGGVASGTELYYSFNYGNIHFLVLDPVTSDLSVGGDMYNWAAADLDANSSDWLIAFFHYPPYSKGGHDSDSEQGMIDVRQNFGPLLESFGVDLVLTGHSHTYERSKMLDSFYGYSWEMQPENILNSGSGRIDDAGAYVKSPGLNAHEGTVYVVAGSSGLTSGGSLDHPAMYLSENAMGSLILDINGNVLQATFLRKTGVIDDYFTIVKGSLPETIRISQILAENGAITVVWNSVAGRSYQVERKESLAPGAQWAPASPTLQATDSVLGWTDEAPPQPTAFYRIVEIAN